jgi:hypothetical protein
MQLEYTKSMLAGVWLLTGCLVGLAADAGSPAAWALPVGFVLASTTLMLQLVSRSLMRPDGLVLLPQEARR